MLPCNNLRLRPLMGRTPPSVAVLHHAGGGNLGDDASIEATIAAIRQRWPDAKLAVFSMNPEYSAERHHTESYPIRRHTWKIGYASPPEGSRGNKVANWLRTTRVPPIRIPRAIVSESAFLFASRRRIRRFDVLVLSGGGQFTERSGPWGFPYAIRAWFALAKSAGVKCVVLNVGAGPLYHPLSKFLVAGALRAADYVSFRDGPSKLLARRIGFDGESFVFPDNVYNLRVPGSIARNVTRHDPPIVGIAPMPFPFRDMRMDPAANQAVYEAMIGKFAIFASKLMKRGYVVKLFGTDLGADAQALEDLRTILSTRHNIATRPPEIAGSVSEMLARMSTMDYVVTCRFHGVVFAHLLNKPVLAVSHHPKVADLMSALGMATYCDEIRTFDPDALADTFDTLVRDTDEVKARMARTLADRQASLSRQYDELFPPMNRPAIMHSSHAATIAAPR